jgi:hypothetical protein
MSGCPYPELPVGDGTDDMLVVSDDFESGEAVTWLYGAEKYSDEFDTYFHLPPVHRVNRPYSLLQFRVRHRACPLLSTAFLMQQ